MTYVILFSISSTIMRRNVGVSMYGGSVTPNVMPTVVVRGHRGSRVLAARWSGVLDDAPLAVLALDTRPHGKIILLCWSVFEE